MFSTHLLLFNIQLERLEEQQKYTDGDCVKQEA